MRFKNYIWGLLVALASLAPLGASAEQTQWKQLAPDLRATEYFLPSLIVKTATVVRNAGSDSYALSANMSNGSVGYNHISIATSSIAPFPYPQRFNIRMVDLGSATTPVVNCALVVIRGNGPNGLTNPPEYFSNVVESAQLSTYSYEQITSVEGSGCSGGGDTSDDLVIYGSPWVYPGVPMRTNTGTLLTSGTGSTYYGTSNLVAVCGRSNAATVLPPWTCVPGYLFEFHAPSNTINLQTAYLATGSPGWPAGMTSGHIGLDGRPHLLRVRAALW